MTTIRVGKRERFTIVPRETVNDPRLSFRARGVLLWLLDKPDDWHTNADQIAQVGREGRDAVRAALKELLDAGYMRRNQFRLPNGKWASEVTVFEVAPSAVTGNQRRLTSAGQPSTVSQALTTKTVTNTVLSKAQKHGQSLAALSRHDAQDVADGYDDEEARGAFLAAWEACQDQLRSEGVA